MKNIPQDEVLKNIAILATRQLDLESRMKAKYEEAEDLERQLREVSENLLPGAMAEAHLLSFQLTDGHTITVKDEVEVSIPKDGQDAAFSWLEKNGFGGLIKRVIAVSFGKGEDKKAASLGKQLEKQGLAFENKKSVHAGTLKAFVKEQLAAKKDIPLQLFGAFPHQKTIIK